MASSQFDQFLKETLCLLATPFGEARASEELISEPQEADVFFRAPGIPVDVNEINEELSLIARMYTTTCLIEGYHKTPGLDLVLECLRKQLVLHHRQVGESPGMPVPALWILSAGKPKGAIEGLGFTAAVGWPTGVYRGPQPRVPGWIVAINELPEVPATLLWRSYGAGRVLSNALRELKVQPEASAVRRVANGVMHRLKLDLDQRKSGLNEDEKEWTMVTQEYFENYKRGLIQEGEARGEAKGEAKALLAILDTRGLGVTEEERTRIMACQDLAQLERFLRRAVSAASTDEVLG